MFSNYFKYKQAPGSRDLRDLRLFADQDFLLILSLAISILMASVYENNMYSHHREHYTVPNLQLQ
jgi:hypothetical protein